MSPKKKAPVRPRIVWRSGPPPHIGWWNASISYDLNVWRWWNGRSWSVVVRSCYTANLAAKLAWQRTSYSAPILWNDRWPEGARVPRIDPGPATSRPKPGKAKAKG